MLWSYLALDGAKYEPAIKSDSDTKLGTTLSTHYKLSYEQYSANTLDVDTYLLHSAKSFLSS